MAILLGLIGPPALAQDPPYWSIRGLPDLPSETRIALSKVSEPIWHKVSAGQSSYDEILQQECGTQPAEAQAFLQQKMLDLNLAKSLSEQALSGEFVAVPFCLKAEPKGTVTVMPNDTPEAILKREYGIAGPKTVTKFFRLNQGENYPNQLDFEYRLKIGDKLNLPAVAPPQIFVEKASLDEPWIDPGNLIASYQQSYSPEMAQPVDPVNAPEGPNLNYVESIEYSDTSTGAGCSANQPSKIFDRDLVIQRFGAEREAKKSYLKADVTTTIIGIVDSGLSAVGDAFFNPRLFAVNAVEAAGETGFDDDGNKRVDDIYGFNFNSESGIVNPSPLDPDRAHGTKMAALALGGLDLAPYWAQSVDPLPVRLRVVNFSIRRGATAGPAAPDYLPRAIQYLRRQGARVINLSLATEENISVVENSIKSNGTDPGADSPLIVIAAGNRKLGGKNLNTVPVYPAFYGGRFNSTVITVGAHNQVGGRAAFSNFSKERVDLMAPGCGVPTRSDADTDVLDNGTSPATAIVSFVAALIRSLGIEDAGAIKNRILAGTDFDPILKDDAWSSGRLNILKAISVYHDVVELRGQSSLRFGALKQPVNLMSFCEENPGLDVRRLKKVIPNIEENGKTYLEYWVDTDGTLNPERCVQKNSDASIGQFDDAGSVSAGPALRDVKEIVLGTFLRRS